MVIKTLGVQDKNNECEDDAKSEILDKDIPEDDVHHPHLTSPTEQWI